MSERRSSFIAGSDDDHRRLDVVLARRLGRSRAEAVTLIKKGLARVNGATVKPSHVVVSGERVDAVVPAERTPVAQDLPLRVRFEDDDIAVIDKPAGMATHPAAGRLDGTLVNALLHRYGALPPGGHPLRPGIVHRLDKDTTGLIVAARSPRAFAALSRMVAGRELEREYDAVVWGVPENRSGTIDAPLGRHPRDRLRFAVRENGKPSRTYYDVRETFGTRFALVRARLETGRTHQIRVHFAALRHPVVGDRTYGGGRPAMGIARQALHAAALGFTHPFTGEALRFEAPWPDDLRALVARLRTEPA